MQQFSDRKECREFRGTGWTTASAQASCDDYDVALVDGPCTDIDVLGSCITWQRLIDDDNPRDAARKMARILRDIVDLGRDECERRVARFFDNCEARSIVLMVESSTLTRPLSLVPARFDFDIEGASIAHFDDLLMAASTIVGGAE